MEVWKNYKIMQQDGIVPNRTYVERRLKKASMSGKTITPEEKDNLEKEVKLKGLVECINLGIISNADQLLETLKEYQLLNYNDIFVNDEQSKSK